MHDLFRACLQLYGVDLVTQAVSLFDGISSETSPGEENNTS